MEILVRSADACGGKLASQFVAARPRGGTDDQGLRGRRVARLVIRGTEEADDIWSRSGRFVGIVLEHKLTAGCVTTLALGPVRALAVQVAPDALLEHRCILLAQYGAMLLNQRKRLAQVSTA